MMLQWKLDSVRKAMPPQGQTQASTIDQLECLHAVANHLGLYDAADYIGLRIKTRLEKRIGIRVQGKARRI